MTDIVRGKGLKSLNDPLAHEYPKIVFDDFIKSKYTLPPVVNYQYIYPEIDDQGPFGTCTAFGSKKMFEFFYRKRKGDNIIISADGIFSSAKSMFYPNDKTDDGLQVTDVLRVLQQFYVLDRDMPYDPTNFANNLRPVPDDVKKTDFKIQSFSTVNPGLEDMKLALYHHGVLTIGIDWQQEWMEDVGHDGILQPQETNSDGGHCVAIVGYDDRIAIPFDNTKGAFLIANNWGKNWAKNGYAWLPYTSQTYPIDVFTVQA